MQKVCKNREQIKTKQRKYIIAIHIVVVNEVLMKMQTD